MVRNRTAVSHLSTAVLERSFSLECVASAEEFPIGRRTLKSGRSAGRGAWIMSPPDC